MLHNHQYLILLCFVLISSSAFGQTKVQVVTQKIQKSIIYDQGNTMHVVGERAAIEVRCWNKNYYNIEIDLISKHPERARAESDLKTLKYVIEQQGKNVYVRNFVELPRGKAKPQSSLKARMIIHAPKTSALVVRNYFGSVVVDGAAYDTRINGEFVLIEVSNVTGRLRVEGKFGEIRGSDLSVECIIESNRADVTLQDLRGTYRLKAQTARIEIFADDSAIELDIDADKCEILIHDPSVELRQYDLNTLRAIVAVPKEVRFNIEENSNGVKYSHSATGETGQINIYLQYGEIEIRNN